MTPIQRIAGRAEYSEKAIEKYLRRRVTEMGGLCLKYSNQAETGYPDRLIVMPGGRTAWAEIKSKGCRPTALQSLCHRRLRSLGHICEVLDSRTAVDDLISRLER